MAYRLTLTPSTTSADFGFTIPLPAPWEDGDLVIDYALSLDGDQVLTRTSEDDGIVVDTEAGTVSISVAQGVLSSGLYSHEARIRRLSTGGTAPLFSGFATIHPGAF